jgi:hypothetical protein
MDFPSSRLFADTKLPDGTVPDPVSGAGACLPVLTQSALCPFQLLATRFQRIMRFLAYSLTGFALVSTVLWVPFPEPNIYTPVRSMFFVGGASSCLLSLQVRKRWRELSRYLWSDDEELATKAVAVPSAGPAASSSAKPKS